MSWVLCCVQGDAVDDGWRIWRGHESLRPLSVSRMPQRFLYGLRRLRPRCRPLLPRLWQMNPPAYDVARAALPKLTFLPGSPRLLEGVVPPLARCE